MNNAELLKIDCTIGRQMSDLAGQMVDLSQWARRHGKPQTSDYLLATATEMAALAGDHLKAES